MAIKEEVAALRVIKTRAVCLPRLACILSVFQLLVQSSLVAALAFWRQKHLNSLCHSLIHLVNDYYVLLDLFALTWMFSSWKAQSSFILRANWMWRKSASRRVTSLLQKPHPPTFAIFQWGSCSCLFALLARSVDERACTDRWQLLRDLSDFVFARLSATLRGGFCRWKSEIVRGREKNIS